MFKVTITYKVGKTLKQDEWTVDDKDCFFVTNEGVTIYNEDGSFRAYYYSHSVISVECEELLGDNE